MFPENSTFVPSNQHFCSNQICRSPEKFRQNDVFFVTKLRYVFFFIFRREQASYRSTIAMAKVRRTFVFCEEEMAFASKLKCDITEKNLYSLTNPIFFYFFFYFVTLWHFGGRQAKAYRARPGYNVRPKMPGHFGAASAFLKAAY